MRAGIGSTLVASAMAVGVVPAHAGVTIGQTGVDNFGCSDVSVFQDATAAPPDYRAPTGGVITSWSHAVGTPGGSGKLLVVRDTQIFDSYVVAAKSEPLAFAGPGLATQAVRIPVQQGERIAFRAIGIVSECYVDTNVDADVIKTDGGGPEPAVGGDLVVGPAEFNQSRANLSAVLEPDADGDGFGDETQDLCPTQAATQGACVVPAVHAIERTVTITYREDKAFKGKVKSANVDCTDATVSVLRKKLVGKTKLVGKDKTNTKGIWKVPEENPKPGKYFARIGELAVGAGVCSADDSPTIKLK